ncbi:MAG: DUF692 family protein [Sphingobacteriales bacterium]|nr:MAG: DUF692 family protein [Sphingobacteriales bacterium]
MGRRIEGIIPGIATNLDAAMLSASLPLLEAGKVGGLEWSFDALYARDYQVPDWFHELLLAYSEAQRLVGHGVFFSLFSGRFSAGQQAWLERLRALTAVYQFDHITEHFGFMTGRDFHKGAPLSVPYTANALAIGRDRISRIADAAQCPVGLENLAFAYDLDEVKIQGRFLDELLNPVNGFMILDLHNLYCQLHNFNMDITTLLDLYPLDKVREIHISGGSWEPHPGAHLQQVRRDTHDDAVPAAVFELLPIALRRCPNLKFVMLEQLGTALTTPVESTQFQEDFNTMQTIIEQYNREQSWPRNIAGFEPASLQLTPAALVDEQLFGHQQIISHILETAADYQDAMAKMQYTSLAGSDWHIEKWQPAMVDTAIHIAQKWK